MSILNNLLDKVSNYIRLKGEKLKLEVIAQVSRLLAHFVAFMLIVMIGLFMLVFLSVATGAYFNSLLESTFLGYLIVAGFYLVLMITIILLLRTNRLQNWLEALFIKFSESISEKDE